MSHLLLSQKNEILSVLLEAGFDPADFEWETLDSRFAKDKEIPTLVRKGTAFFFAFDFTNTDHYAIYSPGKEKKVDGAYPGSWSAQVDRFLLWLGWLNRELEQRDLWSEVGKDRALLAGVGSEELTNEPFTTSERELVAKAIDELKAFVGASVNAPDATLKQIDDRLSYLESATERLGKKDWTALAVGVLVNIYVGFALDLGTAKELFRLAGSLLGWLVDAPLPLPE